MDLIEQENQRLREEVTTLKGELERLTVIINRRSLCLPALLWLSQIHLICPFQRRSPVPYNILWLKVISRACPLVLVKYSTHMSLWFRCLLPIMRSLFLRLVQHFLKLPWLSQLQWFTLSNKTMDPSFLRKVWKRMIGWMTYKTNIMRCTERWKIPVERNCLARMLMIFAWYQMSRYRPSSKSLILRSTKGILVPGDTWWCMQGRCPHKPTMINFLSTNSKIVWLVPY